MINMDDLISKRNVIEHIVSQYNDHGEAIPEWLHIGDLPSEQGEQREEAIIDPVDLVRNLADRIGIHQLYAIAWDMRGEPAQRTGRWIKADTHNYLLFKNDRIYKCSNCGRLLDFEGVNGGRGDANFCPNCGAEMEVDA